MNGRGLYWKIIGLLILSVGTSISNVYMFRDRVSIVMTGIGLVVIGYQLIHYGTHGDGLVRWLSNHEFGDSNREATTDWIKTIGMLTLSVFFVAQGFVLGAQATIGSLRVSEMGACGLFIVGGYVIAHVGVHGELL